MDVHMGLINKEAEEADKLLARKGKVKDIQNMISNLEK